MVRRSRRAAALQRRLSFSNAPRHAGDEALAARAAAVATRHVGCCASLIDEDQVFRLQLRLARTPRIAGRGDIWPVLLGGSFRLFLSGSLRNFSLFPQAADADVDPAHIRQPGLQFLQCRIGTVGHPRTNGLVVGCELRLASRPPHPRGRLPSRAPAINAATALRSRPWASIGKRCSGWAAIPRASRSSPAMSA
jgi:hypothetical protein